ncbi:lipase [Rhodococcus oxybenzonivorans]|uniref:Lipase n=1 Tax=Rhodococcus oxybenzonivorans TaxID=1990687 RepID=A0A2S2BU04_9NOCA|nr:MULTISPECIES: alpha/beta hydrolase [Rhodococcus]AWK72126.1 lipase [Rhodococcus oxybenzonivorans]QTJ64841.1 alpha/beta hydrolase [Rhodococcus sp. ZPP]
MDRIRIAYGTEPQQFGHFYAPEEPVEGPVPVVMVVHGGFWSGKYHLNLGTSFSVDLARHGVAVWNIEYRRLGAGGTWDEMSVDVVAALEAIAGPVAEQSPVAFDLSRVRVVGHSAGGQLAVWLAGQSHTAVRPDMVVAQAGALDLASAAERGRRIGYIEDLLGVPFGDDPERYRSASPYHRIPIGVPVVCVHGTEDVQVPAKVSVRYSEAARAAGDPIALHVVEGEDHYAFLNPETDCWKISRHALLTGPVDG